MVTVNGTSGDDTLIGTGADDTITGLAGDDILNGRGGMNTIYGGTGKDTIKFGLGVDAAYGGVGADTFIANGQSDILVDGGAGIDTLDFRQLDNGGSGVGVSLNKNHIYYRSDGGEELRFHAAENFENVIGTSFDDTFSSGSSNSTLWGRDGADGLYSYGGSDFLYGGKGSDRLEFRGNDVNLSAGKGNDEIELLSLSSNDFSLSSAVTVYGGKGTDTFTINTFSGLEADVSAVTFSGIEVLQIETGSSSVITFTAEQLTNGFASDTVIHCESATEIQINLANATSVDLSGYTFDVPASNTLAIFLNGDHSAEQITGSTNRDYISGVAGQDTIKAGAGSDLIFGGLGADIIKGGSDRDFIFGGKGADKLTGGAGDDAFILASTRESGVGAGNRDVITDFVSGEDAILLDFAFEEFDDITFIGTDNFTGEAGEVRFREQADGIVVKIDLDGGALPDLEVFLKGATSFTDSDIFED